MNALCGNYTVETEEFIQILHNGSDHWLAITTIGTKHQEVIVYNSLYSTVSDNIKPKLQVFSAHKNVQFLKFVDVLKQARGCDCGVFAIVYATTLCLQENTASINHR